MTNSKELTPQEMQRLKGLCADEHSRDWGDLVRGSEKWELKRLATKYLLWVSGGAGKVRFSPGGVAVSGDVYLNEAEVYVQITPGLHGILWRTHPRGANNWVSWERMDSRSWYDEAVRVTRRHLRAASLPRRPQEADPAYRERLTLLLPVGAVNTAEEIGLAAGTDLDAIALVLPARFRDHF